MSDLQVGLLGVGAVVVAAVFLYNKWQERRYGRQAEAGFASRHEDVLMRPGGPGQGTLPTPSQSGRIEPGLVAFEREGQDAAASVAAPFSGTQIAGVAKAAGFRLDEPDGKFRLRDDAGRVVCALANFEQTPLTPDGLNALSTRGVTLELDVPRASHGAFARFRDCAQTLAQGLKARIVDDNREPVGPAAFDAIGAQLQAVHRSMESRGIVPGGALALRLFS